ncbi:MAG: type II toxin-antitoxin system HicB family antitoxin, partial [Lachnospiraceae bacterium]|nr:type II toxin-antitoxin system HicB family antitoxin [Lachnospiraceae bacterium]
MKTLNDYMAMSYKMEIVEDKDEGGFVVSYPDLPGCITCGETVESAIANAQDAKRAWLVAALEEEIEISEPDNLEEYSGQFKLRIPRSLHRLLAEHSKKEGISMNQYC